MKDFNYREDRHGEKNHFRIKRSAEDFLKLRKTGYKNKILALEYTLNISGNKIDCITRQDGQLILVEFFKGVRNSDFGDGIFGKITRIQYEIRIQSKVF